MDRIVKLKEFLLATPDDNFLNHALAMEYIKLGDDEQARQLLETLLTRDPAYIGSYYHIAQLYERIGSEPDAIKWYEKGIEAASAAGDKHALGELRSAYEQLIY